MKLFLFVSGSCQELLLGFISPTQQKWEISINSEFIEYSIQSSLRCFTNAVSLWGVTLDAFIVSRRHWSPVLCHAYQASCLVACPVLSPSLICTLKNCFRQRVVSVYMVIPDKLSSYYLHKEWFLPDNLFVDSVCSVLCERGVLQPSESTCVPSFKLLSQTILLVYSNYFSLHFPNTFNYAIIKSLPNLGNISVEILGA